MGLSPPCCTAGVSVLLPKQDKLAVLVTRTAPWQQLDPDIADPRAGESVYGEKRVSVEVPAAEGEATKTEYRIWNPFRSKLAASILAGIDNIHIKPGAKVLYLGAASGTSVSHVSDIVGPEGSVFAVEFSHRSGE